MGSQAVKSFSVEGKTAVVTGAGSGINFEFAQILLAKNCNVVIADLALRPEAQALVSKYDKSPRAVFVKTDVTSWNDLTNAFKVAVKEFGDFDIVCPGAGVYEPHFSNFWHPPGSPESKDPLDGDHYKLLDINLTHPIRATQIAIAHWQHGSPTKVSPENPKRVIHISSIAGQCPTLRCPMYGASKFGVTGFVRCLAELEGAGIRVNAVAPGVVRTPLWTEHPEKLQNVKEGQDEWVTPVEVAEAMLACVESEKYPGGTVLEVGKDHTREVQLFNDPGPDTSGRLKGVSISNSQEGDKNVWDWLGQKSIWGSIL
ncbi:3-hydroxybutyrate dehydrogenase [Fusarium austroafricanum]|uniref:3-hydroxybutyrate dehydrogenase n=1 Tax=Fusarium austroafricanum TaxID=2364996 RepID=A0A8H4KEX5_9HYPO|nr:3-hydroxybutyrate dehydrogenase [Fusarium austroafricanum]